MCKKDEELDRKMFLNINSIALKNEAFFECRAWIILKRTRSKNNQLDYIFKQ